MGDAAKNRACFLNIACLEPVREPALNQVGGYEYLYKAETTAKLQGNM